MTKTDFDFREVSVKQFPGDELPNLWEWINQERDMCCDDCAPTTIEAFHAAMSRIAAVQIMKAVCYRERVCGFLAIQEISPHAALISGLYFDKAVHGTGIAFEGVGRVLDEIFRGTVAKVSAVLFADNERAYKFLKRLGAEQEGYLRAQSIRNGIPTDAKLLAIHRAAFMCRFLPVETAGVM